MIRPIDGPIFYHFEILKTIINEKYTNMLKFNYCVLAGFLEVVWYIFSWGEKRQPKARRLSIIIGYFFFLVFWCVLRLKGKCAKRMRAVVDEPLAEWFGFESQKVMSSDAGQVSGRMGASRFY